MSTLWQRIDAEKREAFRLWRESFSLCEAAARQTHAGEVEAMTKAQESWVRLLVNGVMLGLGWVAFRYLLEPSLVRSVALAGCEIFGAIYGAALLYLAFQEVVLWRRERKVGR